MYDLNERVSYLRGLADGTGIREDTDEGKLLIHIIDVLDEMAQAMSELETSQSELDDYVETIDGDLTDLEDQVFGEESDGEEEDEDSHYIEVECPHCHETVFFDEGIFDGEDDIVCPNCNKTIYSEDGNDIESHSD